MKYNFYKSILKNFNVEYNKNRIQWNLIRSTKKISLGSRHFLKKKNELWRKTKVIFLTHPKALDSINFNLHPG